MELTLDIRVGRGVVVDGGRDRVIQAMQEPVGPLDALILIVAALFVRPQKHEVRAESVGSVPLDELVGDDHVTPAFGHLGPVADDGSVGAKSNKRLVEVEVAQVVEGHGDEACVEEV